jgi:hypothetical protein
MSEESESNFLFLFAEVVPTLPLLSNPAANLPWNKSLPCLVLSNKATTNNFPNLSEELNKVNEENPRKNETLGYCLVAEDQFGP